MPSDFRATLNALDADARRSRKRLLSLALVGLLLALWLLWFERASLPLYAVSESARIQASADVHPVDAQVAGRVTEVHLPVGGRVEAGDVLLRLDPTDAQLRLDRERAKRVGLEERVAAMEAEISAHERVLEAIARAGQASHSEAVALRDESTAVVGLAVKEGSRIEQLSEAGVVPEAERDQARAAVAQKRASATARQRRLSVLQAETERAIADRRAEMSGLTSTIAELRTHRATLDVEIRRLTWELEQHTVRAPVAGYLGQVKAPRIGSVVTGGQTVAVVTPVGRMHIAADFSPAQAVGRIRVGQRARMRVTGFPWTKYGTLEARVAALSSEAQDGRFRVELAIDEGSNAAIPITHGLSGTVEIQLESVSPATVVLREASGLFEQDGDAE